MTSCETSSLPKNLEDSYLAETTVQKDNFYVITGCSGGGKSTLLSDLSQRGYEVVPEPGRQIVKEQKSISGFGIPSLDLNHFLELALSRYLFQFNARKDEKKIVFFDRGILDALQPGIPQGGHYKRAAEKFRYNKKVFIVPPWPEIYKKDRERENSYEEALEEYEGILEKYKNFSYEVILVPKVSVKERGDFILSHIL